MGRAVQRSRQRPAEFSKDLLRASLTTQRNSGWRWGGLVGGGPPEGSLASSRQRNKGEHRKAWGLTALPFPSPLAHRTHSQAALQLWRLYLPWGLVLRTRPKRKCWEGLTGRSQVNPVVTRMRTAPIETAQPGLGRVEPDILDFPVGRRLPSVSAGALAAEGERWTTNTEE